MLAGQHAGQLKDNLASEVEVAQHHAQAAHSARKSAEDRFKGLEREMAELQERQKALQVPPASLTDPLWRPVCSQQPEKYYRAAVERNSIRNIASNT